MEYDRFTEMKLTGVCPLLATRWKQVAESLFSSMKYQLKVTEGLRTFAQQWEDYGEGRKKNAEGLWVVTDPEKVITHAQGGQSYHQYGLAIDSCFLGQDPYLERLPEKEADAVWEHYGHLCEQNGLGWGGNFKDPDRPHCELTGGLSISDVQIIYERFGLKGVWGKFQLKETKT